MTVSDMEERKAILRTAHDWRYRMDQQDIAEAERSAFESWLAADPRHAELYDRAVTFYQAMGTLEGGELGDQVLSKTPFERWFLFKTRMAELFRPRFAKVAATAGTVASIALAALVFLSIRSGPESLSQPPLLASYETTIGATLEVTLSDGTVVTLGAASAVETSFSDTERTAVLIAGSALFDVESDATRPFTVKAGELNARVLGTVFDVTRSADLVRVSVAEGNVEVSYPYVIDEAPPSMRMRREVAAGEQVAARKSEGLRATRPINIAAVGAWRDEKLYYNGARLAELVADANRYSEARVVIEGDVETVSNYLVQGSFNATDIDGMLSILSDIYPVEIDRSEAGVIRIREAAEQAR